MSAVNPSLLQTPLDLKVDQSCDSKPVLVSHLELLRTCEFSDVTFIVGKMSAGTKDIPLEGTDPKIFHKFLEFIYAEILVASGSEALELLQVAQKYDVQLLVSKCEQVLDSQVMLDAAIDVFQVARMYEMHQLMNKVGNLMAQSISGLQFLPSFSRMDKQTLMYILQRNDLKMTEVDLFRLVMKWAENQDWLLVEQSHIMEDILPLIRFPLMSPEEVTEVVLPTGLLSPSAVIEVFTETMATTMKFRTQQRAVDVNGKNQVALYSAGFTNCPSRQQMYMALEERLEFEVGEILDVGLYSRELQGSSSLVKMEVKKKDVVLNTISLYCPTTTASINCGINSPLTKRFQIGVVSYTFMNNETFMESHCGRPHVEIEEGKMLEVKLHQVPLKTGRLYCISVMESERGMHYERGEGQAYEARDFGDIQENITTTIGDKYVRFKNIRRNHLCGLGGTNPEPNMIYKLGLKEC